MDEMKKFRQCLGQFATGVTVVSCRDPDGKPCGITANSFSSVSLEPPLVLWNIAKVSNSLGAYLNAEHFAINILSRQQRSLAAHFAKSENGLFDDIGSKDSQYSVPILSDTLAHLECRTHAIHDSGDHHIIVGEVIDFRLSDNEPLIFYGGNYTGVNS
ncbi:MAG: flavin reductase [Gammaproteobacteria bacterium]|nr:MAG: flavin reductase [Gammaproteobacteria bacterium]